MNFNRRHKKHVHIFQNRYKVIVAQEDVYLKELVGGGLIRSLEGCFEIFSMGRQDEWFHE